MAAPKGNQFWKLALKHGKEKRFSSPEQMAKEAAGYFEWCDNNPWNIHTPVKAGDHFGETVTAPVQRPYLIEGLCLYLGIDQSTFWRYCNDENYKEYFKVANNIKTMIENQQLDGAMVNTFNANIVARKLGLSDKKELTGKDGGPVETKATMTLDEASAAYLKLLNG